MHRSVAILSILMLLALTAGTAIAGPVTRDYGSVSLTSWATGNYGDLWDLSQGDLTLSYTLDLSGIASPGWSLVEVGLREEGAPNLDPNYQGGWLLSRYASAASGDTTANTNDYHVLMKHGWLDEYYDYDPLNDAPVLAISLGAYVNYAFWFDRDGVDEWQATYWNYKDGKTYNTEGIYQVSITYHARDLDTAGMYVTLNGEEQGFYLSGYDSANPPDFMPVGRLFDADLEKLQVFYGRGGGDGTVSISDVSVTGFLYWTEIDIDIKPCSDPNSLNLKSKGVVPVAILGSETLDVYEVDPASILFAGAAPLRWAYEDVGANCDLNDGLLDLIIFFSTQELNLDENSNWVELTAGSMDGERHFKGGDAVRIVGKNK